MKLRAAGLCASITLLTCPVSQTRAYCRTSTCSSCARDDAGCTIGGKPISWSGACVSFSMNQAASSAVDLDTATNMMREAFAIWENARCGDNGEKPSISISAAFGPALCDVAQYNARAGNANLVIFRDDNWAYSEVDHELAATWLSVDGQGAILDADIEINATQPLSVPVGTAGAELGVIANQRDLKSILVHEAGHFLGLDHSREDGAVMQPALDVGEVRTTLSPDDEAAICAVYPPDREAAQCDYTPRGGFATACAAAPAAGCSTQLQGARKRSSLALLSMLTASMAGLSLWRRRGRR